MLRLLMATLFAVVAARAQSPRRHVAAAAMAILADCQDATNNLEFDRAEALAQRAIALEPEDPLPRVFLQMAILARLQESIAAGEDNAALFERFRLESEAALLLARKWGLENPGARSQLYLGSSLGASGMAKMLNGQYLKAYHDGQAASESLRLAVASDPTLYDAYLGLGQYDYYCGRMGGLLRFVASLHGDVKGGIAMLETCGGQGGIAAIAARIALARIYSLEETDYAKALPYVSEMRQRYPLNYAFVYDALALARGGGLDKPEDQALLESVFSQWDSGWRPPAYAHLKVELSRLELARAYHLEGLNEKAEAHFRSLSRSIDVAFSKAGLKGLAAP